MRRLVAACAVLMVAAMPARAQAPRVVNEWVFPGPGTAVAISALDGGGAALAGTGKTGPRLLHLDSTGRVVEDWVLPGSDAVPQGLAAPPGALALVAGPADPVGHEHGVAAWRLQMGADGRLKQDWLRRFRRTALDGVAGAVALADGGLVAVGWTGGREGANEGAWILRLDVDGDTVWRRIASPLAPQGRFEARAVALSPEGDVLVAAHGMPAAGEPGGVWLLRLDGAGNDRSQIVLDDMADEHPEALAAFADGGMAVAGWTLAVEDGRMARPDQARPWLARLDGRGLVAWEHSWTGRGRLHAAAPLPDGGVLVAGSLGGEALLARLDVAGTMLWERRFAKAGFKALTVLPDGAAMAAGEKRGRPWAVRVLY